LNVTELEFTDNEKGDLDRRTPPVRLTDRTAGTIAGSDDSVTVRVAFRVSATVGLNETLITQPPPPGRVEPQSLVCWKSDASAPLKATL
jgi:hypothetical protein